jgi:hypothetical protein
MTLIQQTVGANGLIEPDFSPPTQAAFVLETIGRPPDFQTNRKFEFTAAKRNMPVRPWSFGTEVKTNRIDYPGSINSPTEQVLSVRLSDFTLSGAFKDKWNYKGYAVEAWRGLEMVAGYGQLVRTSYRSVYCDGIITNVNFEYFHEGHIGYSITLSPHYREPGKRSLASPRTVLNASQLLSEIAEIRNELGLIHEKAPRFFVAGTLWDDANTLIEEWNATISTLENIINQRVLLPGTEPGLALQRIAALFRLVRSNAEAMADLLDAKRSDTDLTYAGALQILRFEVWSKGLLSQAKVLAVAAERASREMLARAKPGIMVVYRPKAGEHLMKISNKFYETPYNWKRIAARNNLGSALVLTGEELLIIPEAVARQ